MCFMEIEVQDKTEDYVVLQKDGIGVEFLGTYNYFLV